MSIRMTFEIPNGQPMMDLQRSTPTALLAQSSGASEARLPCSLPTNTVQNSRLAASPSRVSVRNLKFRLPLCHTSARAKGFFAVEVACGTAEILTAPCTGFRDSVASSRIRPADFAALKAFPRAVFLGPLSGRRAGLSANGTRLGGLSLTPTVEQIAMRGTKPRRLAVGHENRTTSRTFHGSIIQHGIEIEEKYCEIAAKRLQQEVFQFEPQGIAI